MASQPCCVTGETKNVTVHHVRRYGSLRDDNRTIPLVARLHMRTHEKPGQPSIERGKEIFEQRWCVDIEEEVTKHRQRFEKWRSGLKDQ
jgi:hypothetical protein